MNYDRCEYLKGELRSAGLEIPFAGPTFNEFVVKFPDGLEQRHEELLEKNIVAGLPLASLYPELDGHYLMCVTEAKTKVDIDSLVKEIAK